MNAANYNRSIDIAKNLLDEVSLLKQDLTKDINSISDEFVALIHSTDYLKIYNTALDKFDYDLLLEDDSFIQLHYEESFSYVRYAYYQSPIEFPTYEEYLESKGIKYREVGDTFLDYYEQERSEASITDQVSPIRYEYSPDEYKENLHAASHIHIGFNNEIRIPLSTILLPNSFIFFVLRHIYYYRFKELTKKKTFERFLEECKRLCTELPQEEFSDNDRLDHFIN